jgi:hypothetical protein
MRQGRRMSVVAVSATVTVGAVLQGGCSSTVSSTAGPTSSGVSSTAASAATVAASELPALCTAVPVLAPVSPTPTWPSGYRILDALPGALATQYPTVYGGIEVAPATPGEAAASANSHFIVLETARDPALQAQATQAYGAPLTVAFALVPRSWACLETVDSRLTAARGALRVAGITMIGVGLSAPHVVVEVTACGALKREAATEWFHQRWGDAVIVKTCEKIPVNVDRQ